MSAVIGNSHSGSLKENSKIQKRRREAEKANGEKEDKYIFSQYSEEKRQREREKRKTKMKEKKLKEGRKEKSLLAGD